MKTLRTAAVVVATMAAPLVAPMVAQGSPEQDLETIQSFFHKRFNNVATEEFANGVYAIDPIGRENWDNIVRHSREAEQALSQQIDPLRDLIASRVADDSLNVPEATDCLEAIRWLHRVSHHVARINYHLENALMDSGK